MATTRIRKAAVIGGGVMGRGIAAHLANARIPCYLLDIVPPSPKDGEDVGDPGVQKQVRGWGRGGDEEGQASADLQHPGP